MSCAPSNAIDICPIADDIQPQLLATLPMGRAWGTHDGGPYPGTVLYQFWYAVAAMLEWVNGQICALALEFSCATATLTHDLWMEEYGLPDGCDPYPDLCTKVAAIGGARCDYYQAIAARSGWAVTCADVNSACGGKAGAILAGCTPVGRGLPPAVLLITVHLAASAAYVGGAPAATGDLTFAGLVPPLAGRMQAGAALSCPAGGQVVPPFAGAILAGGQLACPVDLTPLECLLTRIVHGHVDLIFETAP